MLKTWVAVLLITLSNPSLSGDIKILEQSAKNYVLDLIKEASSNRTLEIDEIDLELSSPPSYSTLKECRSPLEFSVPRRDRPWGRFNITALCHNDTQSFSLKLRASVRVWSAVVATRYSLRWGHRITEQDLILRRVDLGDVYEDAISDMAVFVGMEARRGLRANKILEQDDVLFPLLVRRGDQVQIVITTPVITIQSSGIAMQDGRLHEVIRVQNDQSGQLVNAQVTTFNLVTVKM